MRADSQDACATSSSRSNRRGSTSCRRPRSAAAEVSTPRRRRRAHSSNADARVSTPLAGNIFGLLANKILELTLKSAEEAVNGFIVDPINAIFDRLPWPLNKLGRPIPRACFTGFWHPSGQCFDGDSQFFDHFGCYNTDRARADEQCYFFRCGRLQTPCRALKLVLTYNICAFSQATCHLRPRGRREPLRALPGPVHGADGLGARGAVPADRGRRLLHHRSDARQPDRQRRELRAPGGLGGGAERVRRVGAHTNAFPNIHNFVH